MKQIGILVTRHYKLLSIAAILEVFETINIFYNDSNQPEPFQITLLQLPDALEMSTDNAFGHLPVAISKQQSFDLVLIPAFSTNNFDLALKDNDGFVSWLKDQFNEGAEIATFCTGAFLLATTGLLNGKIATTHVDSCNAFAAAFPGVKLRPDKTVTHDGKLFTSGGATSTFHLLLHLVKSYCGKDIAVKAAKLFAIDMDRHQQSYFSTFQPTRNHNDELVATAQQRIESNYHDTVTIEEMIKDIPSSRRNIVRRFKQVIGITPIEYLQHTRIEAAKKLLEQTAHQMNEVIFKTGYNDPKSFRKIFRKNVGMTPSEYRDKFHVN
jgi:transcriptional regulator GlxA family with amidase domain